MIQQGWQSHTVGIAGYKAVSKIHYIILHWSPEIFATYEDAQTFEGESTESLSEDKGENSSLLGHCSEPPWKKKSGGNWCQKEIAGGKERYKIVVEGSFHLALWCLRNTPSPSYLPLLFWLQTQAPPALHSLGTNNIFAWCTSWSIAQLMLSGIHPCESSVKSNWSGQGQKLQGDSSCDLAFVFTPTLWIPSQGLCQRPCMGESLPRKDEMAAGFTSWLVIQWGSLCITITEGAYFK